MRTTVLFCALCGFEAGTAVLAASPALSMSVNDATLAMPYYDRAKGYRAKNNYDDAIREYTALLHLFPDDAVAFNERGRSYAIEGDNTHALADYDSALGLDPNFTSAHFNRGVARFSTARFAEATEDFAFAARAEPANVYPALWLHLAGRKASQQNVADSSPDTSGMDLNSWPGLLLRFYRGEASTEDVEAAAAKADPSQHPTAACQAVFYVGEYHMARRNMNTAVPILQDAATRCPHDVPEYDGAIAELSSLP